MQKIIGTLGGKKFILAIFSVIAIMANAKLGMSEQTIMTLGGIVAAFCVGQGVADGLSGGATSSVAQIKNIAGQDVG